MQKKRKSASGSIFDFWCFINSFTYLHAYIHTYLLKNKKADVLQRWPCDAPYLLKSARLQEFHTININFTDYSASPQLAMLSAVLARPIVKVVKPSVCLFVCPSRARTASKWLNLRSCWRIAHDSGVLDVITNFATNFQREHPERESQMRVESEICYFQPKLPYPRNRER